MNLLMLTITGNSMCVCICDTLSVHVYRLVDGLGEMMESCDYVCSILPNTPLTTGLLTPELFKHCSHKVHELTNHFSCYRTFYLACRNLCLLMLGEAMSQPTIP